MISSALITLYIFALPIITGLIAFGLSTARTGFSERPKWEVAAGGMLATGLLSVAILLLTPGWFTQYLAVKQRQAEIARQDAIEAIADDETIARFEARLKTAPNPIWQERWDFFAMDTPFPLQPMDSAQAQAFIDRQTAKFDEFLAGMNWTSLPKAVDNHCEIRQWDAVHGDWNHPLMLWFVRAPNVTVGEGRSSYKGFAMLRGGHPAAILDDHTTDGDMEGGTRLLERLIYNRDGGDFTLYPIDNDGTDQSHAVVEEYFTFESDGPIPTGATAAHRPALLRALPDGTYELTRQPHDYTERYVVRATDPSTLDSLNRRLDDPEDPSDDTGFPVSIYFHFDADNVARHRFVVGIANNRSEYRWRIEHPNSPRRDHFLIRNIGVEKNPQASAENSKDKPKVLHSAVRWRYETTYTEVPLLYGEARCVGRPPGEMKAVMRIGRSSD